MNPLDQHRQQQSVDGLDRLLLARLSSSADPLTRSSGFTQSVMDAVREHATVPEPIPFPWKRFLPFAISLLCVLTAFVIAIFVFWPSHQTGQPVSSGTAIFLLSLSPAAITSLGYVSLAIGLSIITTILSLKLAIGQR